MMNDEWKIQDLVEYRIIEAVRVLLSGRVNELLRNSQFVIPLIEFGAYDCGSAVAPVIALNACERTEKERIIQLDAYSLTITFTLPESSPSKLASESEFYCYAYSAAFSKALNEDVTLCSVVDRAVISGKKYVPPKITNCGKGWEVNISVRITMEGIN
jgi:hypothetical protein